MNDNITPQVPQKKVPMTTKDIIYQLESIRADHLWPDRHPGPDRRLLRHRPGRGWTYNRRNYPAPGRHWLVDRSADCREGLQMRQQIEAGRNAEFSISITKASGNPQMEVNWDGGSNMVAGALICLLAYLTVGGAADISKTTERIVDAYREAVHDCCVEMERDQ